MSNLPATKPNAIETSYDLCSETIKRIEASPSYTKVTDDQLWDLENFIAHAEALLNEPSRTKSIVRAMGVVAETLGVELPAESVCRLQAQLISEEVSEHFIDATTRQLLKTYRYRTFPNPADWIAAAKDAQQWLRSRHSRAHVAYHKYNLYNRRS